MYFCSPLTQFSINTDNFKSVSSSLFLECKRFLFFQQMSPPVFCLVCTVPSTGAQLVATITLPLDASLHDAREVLASTSLGTGKDSLIDESNVSGEATSARSPPGSPKLKGSNISNKILLEYYNTKPLFGFDFTGNYRFVRNSSHLVPMEKEKKVSLESCFATVPRSAYIKREGNIRLSSSFEGPWVDLVLREGRKWRGKIDAESQMGDLTRKEGKKRNEGGIGENVIPTLLLNDTTTKTGYTKRRLALCVLYVAPVEKWFPPAGGSCPSSPRSICFRQVTERVILERYALSTLVGSSPFGCAFEVDDMWKRGISRWNLNVRDALGFTLLHEVVMMGEEEAFSVLLTTMSSHLDVNEKDFQGNTALHWALRRYRPELHFVERLLQAGADPLIPNNVGNSPLHLALDVWGEIASQKGEIGDRNHVFPQVKPPSERKTAIRRKWEERIDLSSLLCNYCNLRRTFSETQKGSAHGEELKQSTSKISPSSNGHVGLPRYVKEIGSLRNSMGVTIRTLFRRVQLYFMDFFEKGNCEMIEKISRHELFEPKFVAQYTCRFWNGFSPLHCAAEAGNLDCLNYLLSTAVSKCSDEKREKNPLTVMLSFSERSTEVKPQHTNKLQSILSYQDYSLRTPLHVAAGRGNLECVKVLQFAFPLGLSLVDAKGNTPFLLAAKASPIPAALSVLHYFIKDLKCEASELAPHARDHHGHTVLQLLCDRGFFSLAAEFIKRFGISTPLKTSSSTLDGRSAQDVAQKGNVTAMLAAAASCSPSSASFSPSWREPPRFFRPLEDHGSLLFTAVVAASRSPVVDQSKFLFHYLARLGAITTLEDMANLLLYLVDRKQLGLVERFLRSPPLFGDDKELDGTGCAATSSTNYLSFTPLLNKLRDENVLLSYFCHRKDHYGIRWCVESRMSTFAFPLDKPPYEVVLQQRSPLHISISRGDVEAVKFLLDAGAHKAFSNLWLSILPHKEKINAAIQEGWLSSLFPLGWALQQPPSHQLQAIIALLIRESGTHLNAFAKHAVSPPLPAFARQTERKEEDTFAIKGPYSSCGLLWSGLVEAAVRGQEEVVRGLLHYPRLYPEATLALQEALLSVAKHSLYQFFPPVCWNSLKICTSRKRREREIGRRIIAFSNTECLDSSSWKVHHRILGYLAPLFDPSYCTLHPFELIHLCGCVGYLDIAKTLVCRIRFAVQISEEGREGGRKSAHEERFAREAHRDVLIIHEQRQYPPLISNWMTANAIKDSVLPPPGVRSASPLKGKVRKASTQGSSKQSAKNAKGLERLCVGTKCSSVRAAENRVTSFSRRLRTSDTDHHMNSLPHRAMQRDIFSYAAESGDTELLAELFTLLAVGLAPWPEGDFRGWNAADYALKAGQLAAFRLLVWHGVIPLRLKDHAKVCCSFSGSQCIISSALLRACKKVEVKRGALPSNKASPEDLCDYRVCATVKDVLLEISEDVSGQLERALIPTMSRLFRELGKWTMLRGVRSNDASLPSTGFPSWLPGVAAECARLTRHSLPLFRLLVEEFSNAISGIQHSAALVAAVAKNFNDYHLLNFLVATCGCSPFAVQCIKNREFMWAILEQDMYEDGRKPVDIKVSPVFLTVLLGKPSVLTVLLGSHYDKYADFGTSTSTEEEEGEEIRTRGDPLSSSLSCGFFSTLRELVGSGKKGEDPFLALTTRIQCRRGSGSSITAGQVGREVVEILRILACAARRSDEKFPQIVHNSSSVSALIRIASRKKLFEVIIALLEFYGPQIVLIGLKMCQGDKGASFMDNTAFRNSLFHAAACHSKVCYTLKNVIANAGDELRSTLLDGLRNCAKQASSSSFTVAKSKQGREQKKSSSPYCTFCHCLSLTPASFILLECFLHGSTESIVLFLSLGFIGFVGDCSPTGSEPSAKVGRKFSQKALFVEELAALRNHNFHTFQNYAKGGHIEPGDGLFSIYHSAVASGGVHLLERLLNTAAFLGLPIPFFENSVKNPGLFVTPTACALESIEMGGNCLSHTDTVISSLFPLPLALHQTSSVRDRLLSLLLEPFLFPESLHRSPIIPEEPLSAEFIFSPENICHIVAAADELQEKTLRALAIAFSKFSDPMKIRCFGTCVDFASFPIQIQGAMRKDRNWSTIIGKSLWPDRNSWVLKQGSPLAVAVAVNNTQWTSHIIGYLSSISTARTISCSSLLHLPQCLLTKGSLKEESCQRKVEKATTEQDPFRNSVKPEQTTVQLSCSILTLSVIALYKAHSRFSPQRNDRVLRSEENVQALLQSRLCEASLSELNVIAIALAAMERFRLLALLIQESEYLLRFKRDRQSFSGQFVRDLNDCIQRQGRPENADSSPETISTVTGNHLFTGIILEEVPLPLRSIVGSHRHVMHAMATAKSIQRELLFAVALRSLYGDVQDLPDGNGRHFVYLAFRRFWYTNFAVFPLLSAHAKEAEEEAFENIWNLVDHLKLSPTAICCDRTKQNLIHLAAAHGYFSLLQKLVYVSSPQPSSPTPARNDEAKLLLPSTNVVPNECDKLGRNALMWACRYGHAETVDFLLTCWRADIYLRDAQGSSAVMHAAMNGHDEVALKLITELGANQEEDWSVDEESEWKVVLKKHQTQLIHCVAKGGCTRACQALIDVTGDSWVLPFLRDASGESSLTLAHYFGNSDIVRSLLRVIRFARVTDGVYDGKINMPFSCYVSKTCTRLLENDAALTRYGWWRQSLKIVAKLSEANPKEAKHVIEEVIQVSRAEGNSPTSDVTSLFMPSISHCYGYRNSTSLPSGWSYALKWCVAYRFSVGIAVLYRMNVGDNCCALHLAAHCGSTEIAAVLLGLKMSNPSSKASLVEATQRKARARSAAKGILPCLKQQNNGEITPLYPFEIAALGDHYDCALFLLKAIPDSALETLWLDVLECTRRGKESVFHRICVACKGRILEFLVGRLLKLKGSLTSTSNSRLLKEYARSASLHRSHQEPSSALYMTVGVHYALLKGKDEQKRTILEWTLAAGDAEASLRCMRILAHLGQRLAVKERTISFPESSEGLSLKDVALETCNAALKWLPSLSPSVRVLLFDVIGISKVSRKAGMANTSGKRKPRLTFGDVRVLGINALLSSQYCSAAIADIFTVEHERPVLQELLRKARLFIELEDHYFLALAPQDQVRYLQWLGSESLILSAYRKLSLSDATTVQIAVLPPSFSSGAVSKCSKKPFEISFVNKTVKHSLGFRTLNSAGDVGGVLLMAEPGQHLPFIFTNSRKKWLMQITSRCQKHQKLLRALPHPYFRVAQLKVDWDILNAPVHGSTVQEDAAHWVEVLDKLEMSMARLTSCLTDRVPTILSIVKEKPRQRYLREKYSSEAFTPCSLTYTNGCESEPRTGIPIPEEDQDTHPATLYFSDCPLQKIDETSLLRFWCNLVAADVACAQAGLWMDYFGNLINTKMLKKNKHFGNRVELEVAFDLTAGKRNTDNQSLKDSRAWHLVPLLLLKSLLDEILNVLMDVLKISMTTRKKRKCWTLIKPMTTNDRLIRQRFAERLSRILLVFIATDNCSSSLDDDRTAVRYMEETGELIIPFTKDSIPSESVIRSEIQRRITTFLISNGQDIPREII